MKFLSKYWVHLLVVVALGLIIAKVIKDSKRTTGKTDTLGKVTEDINNDSSLDLDKVLSKGSQGKEIESLQRLLNSVIQKVAPSQALKDEYTLTIDGDYGNKTELVINQIASEYGLKVDPLTLKRAQLIFNSAY